MVHNHIQQRYERIGRLEIFRCQTHKKLVKQVINLVKYDRRLVHSIYDYS